MAAKERLTILLEPGLFEAFKRLCLAEGHTMTWRVTREIERIVSESAPKEGEGEKRKLASRSRKR